MMKWREFFAEVQRSLPRDATPRERGEAARVAGRLWRQGKRSLAVAERVGLRTATSPRTNPRRIGRYHITPRPTLKQGERPALFGRELYQLRDGRTGKILGDEFTYSEAVETARHLEEVAARHRRQDRERLRRNPLGIPAWGWLLGGAIALWWLKSQVGEKR